MTTVSAVPGHAAAGSPSDAPAPASQIAYVVVAYRSERHLVACLDAIDADRPADASVIVVDNDSPDRSAEIARAHQSRPLLLASPTNVGFGGACNLAIDASHADLMFFVNPDARIRRGTTAHLLAAIAGDPSVAVAGPRIEDPEGDLEAASAGFEPSLRSVMGHFLLLARLPWLGRVFPPLQLPPGSPAQRVDWVSGAAFMARRDALGQVGGFDASMFLYMEDVDLCRRLRGLGHAIRYEPGVAVDHELGGSQGVDQSARWFTAFHAYVLGQRGAPYARLVSAIAAVGLGVRAAILTRRRPAHAQRLARAARTAADLARGITGRSPGSVVA